MTNRGVLFAAIATLARLPAQAGVPCPNQTLECRQNFIDANLADPHRPDLENSADTSDRDLYDLIKDSIARAQDLTKREASLGVILKRTSPRSDEYASLTREVGVLQEMKYSAYNEAIARTIMLYHLAPKITDPGENFFEKVAPMKRWGPHFSECETSEENHCRRFTNEEKRKSWANIGLSVNGDYIPSPFVAGTNKYDARIGIFTDAFITPDALAAVIYHESIHWLDHYALGRTPALFEHFQGEVIAYQREIAAHDAFRLSNSETDHLASIQNRYRRQSLVAGSDWGELKEHPEWLPAESLDIPEGAEPLSEGSYFENLSDLVNQAIRYSHQRSREQESRAHKGHPGQSPPAPVEENPKGKLERLVAKACLNEPTLTQDDVDREFPDGTVTREIFSDCYRAGDYFARSICDRAVFYKICAQEGSPIMIDADKLLSFASNLHVLPLPQNAQAYPLPHPQTVSPPAPSPAPALPPDSDEKEKPAPPDDGCFVSSGVRGCPKN